MKTIWMLIVLCAACSSGDPRSSEAATASTSTAAAQSAAPTTEPTVYSSLETRDHVITLFVGGLYTVKTKDGRVLAEQIDDATLARDFPQLHEILGNGVDPIDGSGIDY